MQSKTPLTTPVVFIIFNRPDLTEKVFAAIAQAKPQKLFFIADGARSPEEEEKCQITRSIINRVDWECEVLTNFSDKNLGGFLRIPTGLDWVFSQVEEAIILEDDCLPAPSFFPFCQTLLNYYRNDRRIMYIGGSNLQFGRDRTPYSYYFSRNSHIWGWATWRRAWSYFDFHLKTWSAFRDLGMMDALFEDHYERQYWQNIFEKISLGSIKAWDHKWAYAVLSQNGLIALPNKNLITNLGFRPDASNTKVKVPWAEMPTSDILNIQHPAFVVRHREADQFIFDYVYGGNYLRKRNSLIGKIRQRLSPIKQTTISWFTRSTKVDNL